MDDLVNAYREKTPSMPQKAILLLMHAVIVSVAAWLLFGGGNTRLSTAIGLRPADAIVLRRSLLLAAAVIYALRVQVTTFVFIKRSMAWSEAFTIGVWILVINVAMAFLGGRNAAPFGGVGISGVVLYLTGSLFNTGSELHRHLWKLNPQNEGRLFTKGLFRLTRHPNYFGDLLLFTGWAMVAGNLWLLIIPLLMFCGFAFLNAPALDRYLAEHYGEQYDSWAQRTPRLVPFLW
ncbi:MAG: DUF1295 domain-containing protein [Thermoanaerobaculia bacterium]